MSRQSRLTGIIALAVFILAAADAARAQQPQPTPLPGKFIHDFAGVIPDEREPALEVKGRTLKDHYRTEIAVVTVQSTGEETSFDYSHRMARSWGIGSKDYAVKGILIVISVGDRTIGFRTSRHIEGELPDGVTGDIRRAMGEVFRQGDWAGGVGKGLDLITQRLEEEGHTSAEGAGGGETARPPLTGDPWGGHDVVGWALGGTALFLVIIVCVTNGLSSLSSAKSPRRRRRARQGTEPQAYTSFGGSPRSQRSQPHAGGHAGDSASDSGQTGADAWGVAPAYAPPDYAPPAPSVTLDSMPSAAPDPTPAPAVDLTPPVYSGGSDFFGGGSDGKF